MLTKYDRDRHVAEIYDATETQTEDIRLLRELIGHRGPLRVREPSAERMIFLALPPEE